MSFLKKIPYALLIPATIFLGLAPFRPLPHSLEKIGMLLAGTLRQPLDIFDLMMHVAPAGLLLLKWLSGRNSQN